MSPISNLFPDNTINLTPYAIVILTTVFSILWYIFKRSPQPSLPPGPRGLPIVGNLPFLDPDLHTYFANLAQSHGPIFKLNLGSKLTIVVNSPSLAREILKDQDINFSNRDVPLTGRAATYGGIDIVWTPYGAEWRQLRKICVLKLLSRKTLDSFYELRRKEVRERTRYLYEQGRKQSPVKVGDQLFLTMMNLTMNMLWGGSVKAEEMESVGTEFKGVISEITRLLSEPNVSDFFPWLARFDLQGLVKRMGVCARELDAVLDRAIEQMKPLRGRDDDEVKDFLQYLMKLKDQEGDSEVPITINHVKALLTDMVVGGTDTSTNTIEFAMAELMSNPELIKRAQEELDEVVGKDNIVEESHITRLPYILAIMKETLRLHPTLPLLVPHRPAENTVVGGYTIPKDTKIFVNVWSIQRDPNVWENPTEFRPERFLDNNSCDFTGANYSYFPFGSGRRICAGVALAERMVLYTLATLLHSFDWKIPEGHVLDLKEKLPYITAMVVVTHISTSFHQISPSFFHLRLRNPSTTSSSRPKLDGGFALSIRAYIEKPNSFSTFANKVIGSLPVIGLLARIISDEGGVGRDLVDFAEFRKRVGNKCTPDDSRAFYEFQQRRGKAGEPLYVLLCCWVAAVGAGLLKSEEILEGVTRVSISNDLEFEEQNFIALMTEARQRRAKLNIDAPTIPMELRVEKALEGIYACCFRRGLIEEEDEKLLKVMLIAVFPSVEKSEIERIIKEKATRVEEGGEEENVMAKRLPKEAIQMQMKDLEFLQQQNIES